MAHMRDEYNNIRQTDGDQTQHHQMGGYDTSAGTGRQGGMAMSGQHQMHDAASMTGGQHGTIPGGTAMHGGSGQMMPQQEHDASRGMHHRSGSSSSSDSEDDGEGGRRKKKGLKERLPGHRHDDQTHKSATTTPCGPGAYDATVDQQQEKKGIMGKIKEKLPGHH
ncbi:dehydrin Xero 1-like [Malania oleifera]|uniref:dehydrin Xero 1-like n=1 Tax=Malania oleifera TaxID=397392 RepID=UPI0025ADEBB5|nr:dehydrin Xero 1-like [Malania oleifera]XP_057952624.1 dehydrin Xero 1-like [Malania oleifera]